MAEAMSEEKLSINRNRIRHPYNGGSHPLFQGATVTAQKISNHNIRVLVPLHLSRELSHKE